MINTIFYFVDTEQEYQAKRNSGEIKPYTIVFVRDTRAIWKNGVRYSGFTEDEIKQIVELETEDINAAIELINRTIEEINQQVSDEKDRLDDVVDGLDSEIQDKVEDLFADSQWIQNNQPQGLVVPYDMSWDNNIQAYLQRVGLWDYNDASIVTKWSTIRQSLNSIQSDVNSITETGGALDLLQSQITQEVTDRGDAITNLGNTYARITDVDGVKDVIEWMYSGLKSGSGADKTYAEIVAAGKNGLSSAISDLRTSVDSLGSTYVAQSSLTSSVDSAISGIINAASGTYANTSMFSKIDTNSDDIAAIATKVTGDTSQSTVAAKLNGMTASLVTTANLDSSIAALSAQAKDTVGNAIAATIFAKANEQGSNITLNADKIYLAGQTWAQYINALGITARNVNVTNEDGNVVAKIDNTGRAWFMNGNLYIPWRTRNADGSGYSYNPNLVFVDTGSSRKTLYSTWGFNNQNSAGITSAAVTAQDGDVSLRCYAGDGEYKNVMSFGLNKTLQASQANVSGPGYAGLVNYKAAVIDGQDTIVAANEGFCEIGGFSVLKFNGDTEVQVLTNSFTSNTSLTVSSDERLKNIIGDIQPAIEDISKVRTVDFQYKNDDKNITRSGSIAQDWQTILPNVVSENGDGYLTLDYESAALISAVTAAKEIVALKKENEDLKQRLAAIEAKLNI